MDVAAYCRVPENRIEKKKSLEAQKRFERLKKVIKRIYIDAQGKMFLETKTDSDTIGLCRQTNHSIK